jgi:transposase
MSGKSGKRERRVYGDEFRRSAVSLVEDQGYTNSQAAHELGIHENLLRTWRRKYGRSAAESSGLSESERDELERLRKDVGRLRMERDILKKATAFFANEKN